MVETRVVPGSEKETGLVLTTVRDLPPAAFAFVMATGIVSTALLKLGPRWMSQVLLALASAGLVVLTGALLARLGLFGSWVMADARTPEKVFGFFTVVAGIDVVGIRLSFTGHVVLTAVLGGIAAPVWLVLTYAIPASLLLARRHDSVLGGVNGTWLLWVVATQSLAITAAVLVKPWPSQGELLAPTAAALWSIGLVLYLVLVSLILLRWLTVPMTPEALGPPYWILMGATAITVLAGARLLELSDSVPVRHAIGGFVEGFSFALWAFGTWWIPLLVVLGLWRHLRHHLPLTYETGLWSVVFPLGMYSVATLTFGNVAHLPDMEPIARVMLWVAVAAWVLLAAAGTLVAARRVRSRF